MSCYNNKNLIFTFENHELNLIDDVWDFISVFRTAKLTRVAYRHDIIKIIQQKYTVNNFLLLELLLEKLYWNLFRIIENKLKFEMTMYKKSIDKEEIIMHKNKILKKSNIKESSVRKAYIYNDKKHIIYYKYNYPNDIDLLLASIMINRSLYETIIINNDKISLDYLNNFGIEPYFNIVEFDYPFPNFNTLAPFVYSKEQRIININKMYYDKDCENNWI
jgi:hypothetical protein